MKRIEHYSFGTMTIAGEEIRGDLFIHPDGRIRKNWWRAEGHRLQLQDLTELLADRPAVLVVGTGASGIMRPAPDLEAQLREAGTEVVFLPTAEAVKLYNSLIAEGKEVAACFHLTC